jgi:hypothetical protein
MFFKLVNLRRFEEKLKEYNGYRSNSILKWKKQMDLPWDTTKKILTELRIINSMQIRQMLRQVVEQNRPVFNTSNCYICKFGQPGKSGEILLYEFRHGCSEFSNRIIEAWQIPSLPDKSTIIFIDDLLGTGKQSLEYITDTLNLFLNPSHDGFLLSLCGTPQGIRRVENNTNFSIICHLILDEETYQHYSSKSKIFSDEEKRIIKGINSMLKKDDNSFDKGLLIAFYYSVPNNTMPFIWKDKYEYVDGTGRSRKWFALLPRSYI